MEQTKKGGRPEKTVKKAHFVSIRLSQTERFVLRQKAAAAGRGLATYIREAAISGKVVAHMRKNDLAVIRQLAGMSNNINQLARKANQAGMLAVVAEFIRYRNEIDQLLNQLRHDK